MAGKKGRSGRLPEPTKLLLLKGTARKDRHIERRKGEPAVVGDGSLPPPPEGLRKEVREAWLLLAKDISHKIYTRDDIRAFHTFAEMWATHEACYEHIAENGISVLSEMKDGRIVEKMSPQAQMWSDLNGKLLQYFARFGMTPSDRTRVREVEGARNAEKENADDEFSTSS